MLSDKFDEEIQDNVSNINPLKNQKLLKEKYKLNKIWKPSFDFSDDFKIQGYLKYMISRMKKNKVDSRILKNIVNREDQDKFKISFYNRDPHF